MTPTQTRWLQHLAATSGLPPHELARRLRQPLEVLAAVWGVTVTDLEPPPPPEPVTPAPRARQLPPPDLGPHVHPAPELSHLAHAGVPIPDNPGRLIPAAPKQRAPLRTEPVEWIDAEPPKPSRPETVAEVYERLRAAQQEQSLPPPTGPVRIR